MKSQFYLLLVLMIILTNNQIFSHCDGIDGPVVKAAMKSLEENNINYTLIWIKPEFEKEVREAFEKVMRIRDRDELTKEIADYYFFETVVRLHREGEGESYTGLKPAGTQLSPGIRYADLALEKGSVEDLKSLLVEAVSKSIEEKFHHAIHSKKFNSEDVENGREFVEAYVQYIHYAERIFESSASEHKHGIH